MKKIIYIFVIFSFFQIMNGQTKRDPRVVGLSGAYTTIAEGIFCVGYNPALITRAHDKPFMLQVYQSDRGFLGNFFSIENVAQFSGDTLNNKENDQLFENFDELMKKIESFGKIDEDFIDEIASYYSDRFVSKRLNLLTNDSVDFFSSRMDSSSNEVS